jgi:hypothetical protein
MQINKKFFLPVKADRSKDLWPFEFFQYLFWVPWRSVPEQSVPVTVRPLDFRNDASPGQSVPWIMRPLDDSSPGRTVSWRTVLWTNRPLGDLTPWMIRPLDKTSPKMGTDSPPPLQKIAHAFRSRIYRNLRGFNVTCEKNLSKYSSYTAESSKLLFISWDYPFKMTNKHF